MRALRIKRGWSAAELAKRMQATGIPWDRPVVAKLENGYRASVSVAELLALAVVLNCPPVMLLTDEDDGSYQVTPAVTEKMPSVRAWIRGTAPLGESDPRDYIAELPLAEVMAALPLAEAIAAIRA